MQSFWLTAAQIAQIALFFPKGRGLSRVDGRRVSTGIIFINRNGLRWRDAPKEYKPPKNPYNYWERWSDKGFFARIKGGLATEAVAPKTVMTTRFTRRRTAKAVRLRSKRQPKDRLIGRTYGGTNTKLLAFIDGESRPVQFFMAASQSCGYPDAVALLAVYQRHSGSWLTGDMTLIGSKKY